MRWRHSLRRSVAACIAAAWRRWASIFPVMATLPSIRTPTCRSIRAVTASSWRTMSCHIRLVDIGLHLIARPLIDDFPSTDVTDVRLSRPGRRQLALDVVDAFADDDFDVARALAQDDDLDQLAAFRHADLDFLAVH